MTDGEHSQEGWHEEKRSAYLYRVMAEAEAGTARGELFNGLAAEAENQAGIWARQAGRCIRTRRRAIRCRPHSKRWVNATAVSAAAAICALRYSASTMAWFQTPA